MGQHSRDRTGMAHTRGEAADVELEERPEEEPAAAEAETPPPTPVAAPPEEARSPRRATR